jgi:DNA-binding transcriptional regulator YiaG
MHTIYALADPSTGQHFYVGSTNTPLSRRLASHVTEARVKARKSAKTQYIRDLLAQGVRPRIERLELVEDERAAVVEFAWIKECVQRGCPLTNRNVPATCHGEPIRQSSHQVVDSSQEESMSPQEVLRLRHRLGMTQKQFAERLGVSVISINRWENGHTSPIGLQRRALIDLDQSAAVGLSASQAPEAVEQTSGSTRVA